VSSQSASHNALGSGPRAAARLDLSGRERDKFYLSRAGHEVAELSYLSGADGVEDARVFAHADLDRDGFEDLIVVNRNAPLLRIYRNQLGPAQKRHFIGVQVEGARQRQAVGARLTARGCGLTQTREVAIGSGFATVNGLGVTLGLDRCDKLDELVVQFPLGERRSFKNVAADHYYRVVEGKGIKEVAGIYGARTPASAAPATSDLLGRLPKAARAKQRLVLVDLFATWCEACKRESPHLEALAAAFAKELDVVSVSIEPKDDADAVSRYRSALHAQHPLLAYDAALARELEPLFGATPTLPSTAIVDARSGQVLWHGAGLPTRSQLARAVFTQSPR
jgi:thiol-disulfide isomerase/thioredoxin